MPAETVIINRATEAIKAVLPADYFLEIWTYDRGQLNALPGITMGWGPSKRVDDFGIRPVKHRHTWLHEIVIRVQHRYDPVDSVTNDTLMREAAALVVDAVEADPTLGERVQASGILRVDEPVLLRNAAKHIVAQCRDVTVGVVLSGAWQ